MSIIHHNTIKAIAHSVDIPKLADDAAKTLAPDVEYRLREVVQVLKSDDTPPDKGFTSFTAC